MTPLPRLRQSRASIALIIVGILVIGSGCGSSSKASTAGAPSRSPVPTSSTSHPSGTSAAESISVPACTFLTPGTLSSMMAGSWSLDVSVRVPLGTSKNNDALHSRDPSYKLLGGTSCHWTNSSVVFPNSSEHVGLNVQVTFYSRRVSLSDVEAFYGLPGKDGFSTLPIGDGALFSIHDDELFVVSGTELVHVGDYLFSSFYSRLTSPGSDARGYFSQGALTSIAGRALARS